MAMMAFALLGGLAIFIYAMDELGRGLQQVAGSNLKRILEAFSSKPILGVLIGALVTAIIQSSSATTVMVIGFTNAGIMGLRQAIAIIMGSNIGTTITSQLITFNITNYYMPMIAIGFLMMFIIKKHMGKNIGRVIFAFGLLFMGLDLMSESMMPLRDSTYFADFITKFGDHTMLALLAGTIFTCIIQSSSASMGILLAMTNTGLITLDIALPIILGFNIGTCITCILASIGTKVTAKRAAFAHVSFNIIGALIFLILMPLFKEFVIAVSPDDIGREIANAHTWFNIITTIILFPFISVLEKIVCRLIPGEDKSNKMGAVYLDSRALHDSNVAMGLVMREVVRMGELASKNIDTACQAVINRDLEVAEELMYDEDVVDSLEHDISEYLVEIKQEGLSEKAAQVRADVYHIINDFERISDHAVNLYQSVQTCLDQNLYFSDAALAELKEIHETIKTTMALTLDSLKDGDKEKCVLIDEDEDMIDKLVEQGRDNHIERLEAGLCKPMVGVVYFDILSNLERVGDRCHNIAIRVKDDF